MVALPTPSFDRQQVERWKQLCGSPEAPIKPGASRNDVRAHLKGERYSGILGGRVETYKKQFPFGSDFWMGPNPEGGLIGTKPRYVEYLLKIEYDEAGLVKRCKIIEGNSYLDRADSYDGDK